MHSFICTLSSPPRALGYEHGRGARMAMTDGSRAARRDLPGEQVGQPPRRICRGGALRPRAASEGPSRREAGMPETRLAGVERVPTYRRKARGERSM